MNFIYFIISIQKKICHCKFGIQEKALFATKVYKNIVFANSFLFCKSITNPLQPRKGFATA